MQTWKQNLDVTEVVSFGKIAEKNMYCLYIYFTPKQTYSEVRRKAN